MGLSHDAVVAAGAVSAAGMLWRFRGTLQVTVIAKATFAFADDTAMTRTAPQDIFREEIHHAKNPGRSIRFSTDLVPYLNRADVLFTGHAHSPATPSSGAPVEALPLRLGVFQGAQAMVNKTLVVRCPGGFQKVRVAFEQSYGGLGWTDNPLGSGADGQRGEPVLFSPHDPRVSVAFAPISRAWPARKRLLGALPQSALRGEVMEIPDDFAWEYFQAAPPDQRTDFLHGDEWLVMDGLHPVAPRVRMRIPHARGLARVYGLSPAQPGLMQPLELHADMLRIDGDEQRCTLTFRGTFAVSGEEAIGAIRIMAGIESAGEPIAWPEPAIPGAAGEQEIELSDADLEAPHAFDGTMALSTQDVEDEALPFQAGQSALAFARSRSMPALGGDERTAALDVGALGLGHIDLEGTFALSPGDMGPPSAPLPFVMAHPSSSPHARPGPQPPPRKEGLSDTITFAGEDDERPAVLPFAAHSRPSSPAPSVPIAPPPAAAPIRVAAPAPPPAAAAPAPAPLPAAAAPVPAPPPVVTPAPPPVVTPPVVAAKPAGDPWAAPPPAPAPAPAPPPAAPRRPAENKKNKLYKGFG